jgi:hypothetical protein
MLMAQQKYCPERSLGLFEGRFLRLISGAVQVKGTWRKKYNQELYKLLNEPDVTKYCHVMK